MLPNFIIEKIKQQSGLSFDNAKDFEVLSSAFSAADRLGVNTLKRLFGYAKSPIAPRKATLDALAHYLGCDSWESLNGMAPNDSEWTEKAVCADEIKTGSSIELEWLPDRKLTLLCIGENRFRVTESLNGKLQAGDEITIYYFRLEHPLDVSHIVRDGKTVCDADGNEQCYVAGKRNGLRMLKIRE